MGSMRNSRRKLVRIGAGLARCHLPGGVRGCGAERSRTGDINLSRCGG